MIHVVNDSTTQSTFHVNLSHVACVSSHASVKTGFKLVEIRFSGGEKIEVSIKDTECDGFIGAFENSGSGRS
jgi:hypothetical protein